MKIVTIRHRGLRRLLESDDTRELRTDLVNRLRRMLTALQAATSMDELEGPPGWRIHQLTGDRAGTWSLSVSGNWRLTFVVEEGAVMDLDLEDYH